MSNDNHENDFEAFLGPNLPSGVWEDQDPLLRFDNTEELLYTQNREPYNQLSALVQQQDVVMGNVEFESEVCPDSSRLMTNFHNGAYGYGPNDTSQDDRLPSSSLNSTHGLGETDTTEEPFIALNRFTNTINQFGIFSQTLDSNIEGLLSRLDDIKHSFGRMERRLDILEHRMDNMYQETKGMEENFKIINGYLLEVIRREKMAMQEFGDLTSRCHERDLNIS